MTSDERQALVRFLEDLVATRDVNKDREASPLIAEAMRNNPDAAYVLVQHAILADQAIKAANARIDELERDLKPHSIEQQEAAFLGAGSPLAQRRARSDEQREASEAGGIFSASSGLGSFLRQAGATAAGVAGGAFLMQGLSNLFGQGGSGTPHHVTINDYRDSGTSDGAGFFNVDDEASFDDGGFSGDV